MICPVCGREFFRPPAISRRDNSSICSRCGTHEALEALGIENIEEILEKIYEEKCE